jgi:hypothetical protein
MTVGALIVARNAPAVAYEPCIYYATPFIVWLVLFINLVCGIGIVIYQVGSKRHRKDNLWILGLGLILLSYTIILSLWIIRGYALWCLGDPAVHLGLIQGIISNGHIGQENIYPIIHIYAAQISSISGVSPIMPHRVIPLIFALLYVAFMYLLAKSVLPDKGQVILALLASMTLMPPTYLNFTPNMAANFVFPLAISLFIKSFSPGTAQWEILFIIMIFLFPVFHPVPTFALFVTMFVIWLGNRMWNSIQWKHVKRRFTDLKFSVANLLLIVVWSISWFSEFYHWDATILNIKRVIIGDIGGWVTDYVEKAVHAEALGFSVTQYFLRLYGGNLIYMIIALLAVPILIKKFQPSLLKLIYLYGPIAVLAAGTIMFFLLRVGFCPPRLVVYIIILCTPFVGFLLYEFLKRMYHFRANTLLKILTMCTILVFLVAVSVHGAARLYPSPYIYMDNWQITRTEIAGMDWFLHRKDVDLEITGIMIMPGQFAQFLLTQDQLVGRYDILTPRGMIREDLRLPWRFGYNNYATLGQVFAQDIYMVLTCRDKSLYRDIFPTIAEIRFTPQDFERINYDPTVNHIYSNGGFDAYFIRGANSS